MKSCNVKDCPKTKLISRGLCTTHYTQWRRGLINQEEASPPQKVRKDIKPFSKCSVDSCVRNSAFLGYCEAHYQRVRSTGDPQADKPILTKTKGGGYLDADGYWVISAPLGKYVETNRKSAVNVTGVYEHQKVMSEYLGRPLTKGENVHHKNGVRTDNRIENLELWTTSQPAGQRVYDKILWAKSLLEKYGEDESIWES